jgi:hypothetical protein
MNMMTASPHCVSFLRFAPIFVIFCIVPTQLHAAGPDVYELAPGVIVDQASSMVYTMHQDKRVEAIDMDNGKQVWISASAEKPLWADDDIVYAQYLPPTNSTGLQVAFLDSNNGKIQGDGLNIPLMDGVRPSIDAQKGKTFSVHFEGQNQILSATWNYLDQSSMPKPFQDALPPKIRMEQGAALLDTASRTVAVVSPDVVSTRSRAPLAVGALLDAGSLKEPYWLTENVASSISDTPNSNGGRIVTLQRWDAETGAVLKELTLYEGQVQSRMGSSDQQHFVVSARTGEAVNGVHQYRWSIFSLASGEAVGEIIMDRSITPFSLVDGQLLHVLPPFGHLVEGKWIEMPPQLRLLDLQSGEVIWAKPIRDTLYRGPVPSNRGSQ